MRVTKLLLLAGTLSLSSFLFAQNGNITDNTSVPNWWDKYQYLLNNGASPGGAPTVSKTVKSNVDVSNECGPQSETNVTINPANPLVLAGGSNEIFRLPMRGYFSKDNGASWGGVDLPLPPAKGANGIDFGSDPTLAFDTKGNVYYGDIVVFFSNGNGINGTEIAVAKSSDGGATYPGVSYFSFSSGSDHFNDKTMLTTDTNPDSPFRDNVYMAWDAASGGSTGGGIRVAASSNGGKTWNITRADNPSGPGRSIGTSPFVGPDGALYVAWNNYVANTISFNRSFDGGSTWDQETVVATKRLPFDIGIPAEFSRGALVYPSCDADRSSSSHRGRLYCSWLDLNAAGDTDVYLAYSDDRGSTWSRPQPVTDQFNFPVDRFNHWMAVDPVTGEVNVSFYDTRNDATASRFLTDIYFTQSDDGGVSFRSPNTRVTTASSNEHDCNGLFPCPAINYGNQQGDYAGLASYGGVSHPIWTDSRFDQVASTGCRTNLLMEEVFSATVK